MEDHHVELIHLEVDGENTPQDSAETRRLLETDPEAAALFEDLERVAGALKLLEAVDPPFDLKESVLRAVRPAPRPARASLLARFLRSSSPTGSLVLRYAYLLLVGVAVGVFLGQFWSFPIPGDEDSGLQGAMAPRGGEGWRNVAISGAGIDGELRIRQAGAEITLEVDLEAARPTQLVLDTGAGANFLGFFHGETDRVSVDFAPGRVQLTSPTDHRYTLVLERSATGSILGVSVVQAGGILWEQEVDLEAVGQR